MSLATTDHRLPTVFEANLPQLDYENALAVLPTEFDVR